MTRARLPFVGGVLAIAAIAALIIALSGGSTSAKQPVAPGSAVSLKQTAIGKTLVDANGRTLYLFANDRRNVSTLSTAGQAVWPPFTAAVKPRAMGGALASQITVIKKVHGRPQVAYNGHPLYYYAGDQAPGQTAGQGLNQFGARWYVLGANGAAITAVASSPAPSTPSTAGSSYGY
jgi:predicted lipoprotein with Yx(FWY)xxD motif